MQYLVIVVVGLFSGVLGGLLGIGGNIILIPALNEVLGVRQHLYQSAGLIILIFVAAPATWQHARAGVIRSEVIKLLIPSAIVGVISGVSISELSVFRGSSEKYLTVMFGLFMLIVAVVYLWRRKPEESDTQSPSDAHVSMLRCIAVGLPTGFFSGLLGVGGGMLAVPLQQAVLGLRIRQAIGNSAATILCLSLVGASYKNLRWSQEPGNSLWEPIVISLLLLPPVAIGSLIGSRLTHKLPTKLIRTIFILISLLGGLRQLSHGLL